jgi:nucleoside 2-deoxyribosyltransferase
MSINRLKLYLAGPLFSEAELSFNRQIRDLLQKYFDVFLPQEDGELLVELIKAGMPIEEAKKSVFLKDIEAIKNADYLLIILDGRSIDEGAAFELGFAYSLDKKCIGYQSDPRRLLPLGNNPMIDLALSKTVTSRSELLEWASHEISISDWDEEQSPCLKRLAQTYSNSFEFSDRLLQLK